MSNWISTKKKLPNEQNDYLIAIKYKNKEGSIWLYEVAFWYGEGFERSHDWGEVLI